MVAENNNEQSSSNSILGVKGLVDSGITRVPYTFHHPPESLFYYQQEDVLGTDIDDHQIPVIDMSSMTHEELVNQIRDAATNFGFFQVINHGVPVSLLDRLLESIKAINELPVEEKLPYYRRDIVETGFGFTPFRGLFPSFPDTWCDSVSARLSPGPVNPDDIHLVCRNEVIEWNEQATQLGGRLMGLLSEGLGLDDDRLRRSPYIDKVDMVGHYYPYCPEPKKTIGAASHTDLGMLTILLQDQVGGLQVENGGEWIDLKPVHGALVVNIGDLFQILSNDKYKSAKHRVYANPWRNARVSIGTFISPKRDDGRLYAPLDELISSESPALYRQLKFSELLMRFIAKVPNSKFMVDFFRL